ncbi:hypothetical protein KQ693_05765 [Thermus sp. PS18]|uniref:hypothetical protein n=1 Tax=Thermus sp. PS18 TaxID=2849039 RepID=UPI002264D4C9|nr:hypothetical protein [Thermus sp. PS18]UZX16536.1 hypothetical protein KQ693_05765 [Thermus sp. PS18]
MGEVKLAPPEHLSREEAMERVRQWLPWVERVLCIQSTPRTYVLVMEDGRRVDIGPVEHLASQRKVRVRVAEAMKVLPRWLDQRYWDDMAQAIMDASEDVEAPEAEEMDLLRAWLESYLDERHPALEEDREAWESHFRMELPLYWKGDLCVNATNFASWVGDRRGHRIRPREMALLLRRYGAEPVKVQRKVGGSNRTRRYWTIPASLLPEDWVVAEEATENAFAGSQIVGGAQVSDYLTNSVQDGEKEGGSQVVRSKNGGNTSQVSDYLTTEAEKPVLNGVSRVVRYDAASDYLTTNAEKDFSTEEGGEDDADYF